MNKIIGKIDDNLPGEKRISMRKRVGSSSCLSRSSNMRSTTCVR